MKFSFFNKLTLKLRILHIKLLKALKLFKEEEVYYIGGSEVLPPPLDKEEESYLLSKLKKDENVKTIYAYFKGGAI